MAKKLTKAQKEAQENLKRIEEYVFQVNLIYDDFIEELAKMAGPLAGGITAVQVFSFDDFPSIKKRLNELIKQTNLKVVNVIEKGNLDAFLRSNAKNDALVDSVFKNTKIPKSKLSKYYDRNLAAVNTRAQKSALSPRVFKITKNFTKVAELGIDNGIGSGKSARMLASEIRKAVKDPKFAMRRIRNEKGNLVYSKAMKQFHKENPPGQGVYLNPQKNFERLTRTEINVAYRTADFERTKELDFVVGIKVNLSTNPNHCPMCLELQGLYPKTFLFRGWHVQCRCYTTTVLKTAEEISRDNILILQGKEPLDKSLNTVKTPNDGFKKWMKDNRKRIKGMEERGALPYWLQDNFKKGQYNKSGLVPGRIVGGIK